MKQQQRLHTCVESTFPYNERVLQCGKTPHRGVHGWLCFDHLRQQQQAIPRPKRIPYEPYRGGVKKETDDEILANIIQADTEAIREDRELGKLHRIRLGILDPVFLEISI